MGIKKKEPGISNPSLRNASDFYTIPLEEDYILAEETLESSIDIKTSKQPGWFYPDLKLLSFKEDTAAILNSNDKTSFTLHLKVEPRKLMVSCTCGLQVEMLCIHSFKALSLLLHFDGPADLKKFMPGGAAQTVLDNSKYFETKTGFRNFFNPKAAMGAVYGISEPLEGFSIEDALAMPAPLPPKKQIKDMAMCYIIMVSGRKGLLPFLLPCLGKLNKAGDHIKGFGKFLSGIQKEHDAWLTEEQRTLNSLCLQIWKLVEKLPNELIHEDMLYNGTDDLSKLLDLWHQAFPLLMRQPVYKHFYYKPRQLKGRPSKRYMQKINLKDAAPLIQFKLTDKGAFKQLELLPLINGKEIRNHKIFDKFFIYENDNIYLLSSLRDAAMVEWMKKSGGRITIFKNQFTQFENSFLQPLKKYYELR
ncbi:MAG: hypothetical protein JST58_12725 [Bacteroidetes bacterium]|nr:hypothetical protein [Bacteroidota bacterium]